MAVVAPSAPSSTAALSVVPLAVTAAAGAFTGDSPAVGWPSFSSPFRAGPASMADVRAGSSAMRAVNIVSNPASRQGGSGLPLYAAGDSPSETAARARPSAAS